MERTQNDIKTSVYFHSSISGNEYHESGGAASSGTAKGEPGGEGAGRGECAAAEGEGRDSVTVFESDDAQRGDGENVYY